MNKLPKATLLNGAVLLVFSLFFVIADLYTPLNPHDENILLPALGIVGLLLVLIPVFIGIGWRPHPVAYYEFVKDKMAKLTKKKK